MPRVSIETSTQSPGYKPPYERPNGPFSGWECDDCSNTLERADKIRANPKLVEEISKHHRKEAKHHRKLASSMKSYMDRGLVSDRALHRAESRKRG